VYQACHCSLECDSFGDGIAKLNSITGVPMHLLGGIARIDTDLM
jgi:hypothetical protein